jgi:hypothetical protein
MRCKSNHTHGSAFGVRMCDAELTQRVAYDRIARPAQYQPIEPTIPPAPRWLNRSGKDLTANVRSN